LEGRGLLKVNIADLVAWLDKRMKLWLYDRCQDIKDLILRKYPGIME
jgi:hypothetical protein